MPDLSAPASDVPVTVAFTRRADTEQDVEMMAWVRAGFSMAETFPGFLGAGWLRPDTGSDDWHMLARFESAATLAVWKASPERSWADAGHDLPAAPLRHLPAGVVAEG